jgi:hypothetical protein
VETVKQGAKEIEKWRNEHPGEQLDLFGADLAEAELSGADLREANLRSADLRGANLGGAKLSAADMAEARLGHANLRLAHLRETNLRGADLREADLHGANLTMASLVWAVLRGANLERATFVETVFGDTDLSDARGLDSAEHVGPSVVDERTLLKSGPLPKRFLRGCGLSDQLITYLPSLSSPTIEFTCFISYSSKDDDFAVSLHAKLQDRGVRCWFAPESLKIGDRFRARIDEAIRLYDKLLLILTDHSVESAWVEEEVEAALEKERKAQVRGQDRTVLFPVRLDEAVMESDKAWAASIRRTRHVGDFRRWKEDHAYQEAFERLLRDLKATGIASPKP